MRSVTVSLQGAAQARTEGSDAKADKERKDGMMLMTFMRHDQRLNGYAAVCGAVLPHGSSRLIQGRFTINKA